MLKTKKAKVLIKGKAYWLHNLKNNKIKGNLQSNRFLNLGVRMLPLSK